MPMGLPPRKFRRWANPKPRKSRTAWNKILEQERDAIEAAAWMPELIGKPVSHIFVHGHNSGKFFASLSTVYNVLKEKNLVQPLNRRPRTSAYVNAHSLLDEGFSLLCYDGTLFKTDTGIAVWAIPVMILAFFGGFAMIAAGMVYAFYGAYQIYLGREFRYRWIGDWLQGRSTGI